MLCVGVCVGYVYACGAGGYSVLAFGEAGRCFMCLLLVLWARCPHPLAAAKPVSCVDGSYSVPCFARNGTLCAAEALPEVPPDSAVDGPTVDCGAVYVALEELLGRSF